MMSVIRGFTVIHFICRNYGAELFAFGCRLGEKFEESLLREALTTEEYAKAEARRQQELGVQVRHISLLSLRYCSMTLQSLRSPVKY